MTPSGRSSTSKYWKLVEDCLVLFYAYPRKQASLSVSDTRKRLAHAGVKLSSPDDLVYHSEPIDVASDMAQQPFPARDDFQRQYEQLKSARPANKSQS